MDKNAVNLFRKRKTLNVNNFVSTVSAPGAYNSIVNDENIHSFMLLLIPF